jgi:hypothetical protein
MEIEHREFLKKHYNNYETVQSGYIRNLDGDIFRMYEHIYRTYLDAGFILTMWCSFCIMDMVKRLYVYYESLPIENKEKIESQQIIKTKKKRNG